MSEGFREEERNAVRVCGVVSVTPVGFSYTDNTTPPPWSAQAVWEAHQKIDKMEPWWERNKR